MSFSVNLPQRDEIDFGDTGEANVFHGLKFVIAGVLPDLNKEINEAKKHWARYAEKKREWTEIVWGVIKNQLQYAGFSGLLPLNKVLVEFEWYAQNKRKDPDNIDFAKKYILDGLVMAGVLKDDGFKTIAGFVSSFYIDKEHPRVEVKLVEL